MVNKEVCLISKHLENCLSAGMKEAEPEAHKLNGGGILLDCITSDILEICIKYMHYKVINR